MSPLDGLLPATFRGVPFHVDNDRDKQGREGDFKTFPRRDGARGDDHGLGKREITVEAYISAFETSAVAAEAFRAAMLAPGFGFLSLPNAIVSRALCTGCERVFNKAKIGRIGFTLTFVADDESASVPGLSQLAAAISSAGAALLAGLPALLSPPGGSRWFADGVARGTLEAAALVRQNLPAITTVADLDSMLATAASLPPRGVSGEMLAAERIAKG